jgi:hypothetical protein
MDVIAVAYYGAICAVLSWISPMAGRPRSRVVVGVIVGAAAAIALPTVKGAF